jgi:RNA polymerase sigma factor (sigma-70 family)
MYNNINDEKLNQLAIEYQKTHAPTIIEEVIKLSNGYISKRAEYICKNTKALTNYSYEDVKQDLIVKLIESLNSWKPTGEFSHYLAVSLSKYLPIGLRGNRLNDWFAIHIDSLADELKNPLFLKAKTLGQEEYLQYNNLEDLEDYSKLLKKCTKKEQLIVNTILNTDYYINQIEIANKTGIPQQTVSNILIKLQKKITKFFSETM